MRLLRPGVDPHEQRNLAEARPDRAAALRGLLDEWLDGHVRFEPLLAKGSSNPKGGPLPKAIERGRLGDLLAGPELAVIMVSDAPPAQRREAAQLLVSLPARKETSAALVKAAGDADRQIADWAAIGAARLGDPAARPRVQAIVADAGAETNMRVRAALALAAVGDTVGVPVLGDALEQCEDVLLCRGIVVNLGRLRDRRAVPVLIKHLPEVQNRREMVEALGDIGDPAAADALLERLRRRRVRAGADRGGEGAGEAGRRAPRGAGRRGRAQGEGSDGRRRRPRCRHDPARQDELGGSSRRSRIPPKAVLSN